MTREEKLQKIARHYGYESQSRQCIEEMAELTQAISKYWRASADGQMKQRTEMPKSEAYDNIMEEIADVQIMLSQLVFLLGMDEGKLFKMIDKKLDRQIERMEHET